MSNDEVEIRPSALPMLEVSPMFRSGGTNIQMMDGTARHKSLALAYTKGEAALFDHDEEEREAILWAIEQIKILAPTKDAALRFEVPVVITLEDEFDDMEGTADAVCGSHVFDFKWRRRNYAPQVAAYTLGLMQFEGFETMQAHVLYGYSRTVETIEFDLDSAARLVNQIVKRVRSATECATSEYCPWCSFRVRCPLYTDRVLAIANGREDWTIKNYHTSEISDPTEMGKALTLARLAKGWAEAVEFHAMQLATREGIIPTGFKMGASKGKSYITNVTKAFAESQLPPEEFLKCCDVRLNTSKKYPDKFGLIDAYAENKHTTKAAAKRELGRKLAPVTARGKDSPKLIAVGADDTESEE